MSHHIICLSIDTDPDGLSGKETNRNALSFKGLEYSFQLPEKLGNHFNIDLPISWFIRIDGQIEHAFGNACHLYDHYKTRWDNFINIGHETGWHPHLYEVDDDGDALLISDCDKAKSEITRLWDLIAQNGAVFTSFRNGEGWHCTETMNLVERLGMTVDSTAIPGRVAAGHPSNWKNAPNYPFFPDADQYNLETSQPRNILEIPLNTWLTRAPYDTEAKTRYMNPCVHTDIFKTALELWAENLSKERNLHIWTFICHPDDMMPRENADLLYGLSMGVYANNIEMFCHKILEIGHTFEFKTVGAAAEAWRKNLKNDYIS